MIYKILKYFDYNLFTRFSVNKSNNEGLICILIHSVMPENLSLHESYLAPQQRTSLSYIRNFIEYCLSKNVEFLNPKELYLNSYLHGRKILLTLDDGYRNNIELLPILKQYNIPALFFISPFFIENNVPFFNDIIWVEIKKRKYDISFYSSYRKKFDKLSLSKKIHKLKSDFGESSLMAINEINRPLNESELKKLESSGLVYFANHTYSHSLLTNLNSNDFCTEIRDCDSYFKNYTNYLIDWIAYPSGEYSHDVINKLVDHGKRVGVSTIHKKNKFPFSKIDCGRFINLYRFTLHGIGIEKEFKYANSFINIKSFFQLLKRNYR